MKQFFHVILTLIFILAVLFANPNAVLASEGDDGHELEAEVSGYRVTLDSQNNWTKGENTVVVTITDGMGMPLRDADVDILITSKSSEHPESDRHGEPVADEHTESTSDGHGETEADAHEIEQEHDTMSGMDVDESEAEAPETSVHDEEDVNPMAMTESNEYGVYVVETHLESSGKHDVQVMFHVNGEMLQADFVVEIPGTSSKTVVLWSFVMINVVLVTSAGIMKKQFITVKGGK